MPATLSKTVPKKNAETKDPLRKWEKKLRYAKTEEQRLYAERMILIHTPKEKKQKTPKKQELTDDQLMDQMIRKNDKLHKNPEFIKQQEQTEFKRRCLERERQLNRDKIKNESLKRKEKDEQEMKKQLEEYKQYKQNETILNNNLESHKKIINDYSEKMGTMEKLIKKNKGNVKKAQKEYKEQLIKMCHSIEYTIRSIVKEKNTSYDEAKSEFYENIMNMK